MPMHNWARVMSGDYHNFHFRWLAAIMDRLNAGLLPAGYFAMAEQIIAQKCTVPRSFLVLFVSYVVASSRFSHRASLVHQPSVHNLSGVGEEHSPITCPRTTTTPTTPGADR